MPTPKFFDSANAGYAQEIYEQYSRNPESVPEEWRRIFARGAAEAAASGLMVPEALSSNGGLAAPAAPAPTTATAVDAPVAAVAPPAPPAGAGPHLLRLVARATALVQAFRDHGHQLAEIDPLGTPPPGHPQLDPSFFGTSMEELQSLPASVVVGNGSEEKLADYLERLRRAYCGSIGYQFEHLEDPDRVQWLWDQVESGRHATPMEADEKRWILKRLTQTEGLEQFLHRSYLGQKRFSVEGTDMLIPMLDLALEEAARDGCSEAVLGMAHRGRLNALAHTVGVAYEEVLREFEGGHPRRDSLLTVPESGTGDVKYHHGAQGEHPLRDGSSVAVTLTPNPSHLEFVDPVVAGIARARQFAGPGKDASRNTAAVVPVLIHGDAAFAAEGVVAETLNLARLRGYTTGGIVHLIANNQVGFTTDPRDGRSTRYASDLAKGYDVPILHVNADDPEACFTAVRLAMAYRAEYRDDIVIDLVGYRRYGHNEGDEPAYTQPTLYEKIGQHPTVRSLWVDRLVEEGVIEKGDADRMAEELQARLREAQDNVRRALQEADGHESPEPASPDDAVEEGVETGVTFDQLAEINAASIAFPEGFEAHPKLLRQLQKNRSTFELDTGLDWAHAELLAFGSLLREGIPIRLTGQDSQRGTFSQRHLVFHDVRTGEEFTPLSRVGSARLEVYNSPLSETAVLGYEYGYSVGADVDFVLWEAQFGDFVNVAQPIIDQFISSGMTKWGQLSRLTLLLPHGYEGQGPEHSSARLERFLQLCAEENLRVCYPTTPAQYFHLLRWQAHAPEHPLVVMTPKSLLRHPMATSAVEELVNGRFRMVVADPDAAERRDEVRRLILCAGKVYYDLVTHEARKGATSVAVARVEELYPFPSEELEELVREYPGLEEVIWTQEEPRNMGALSYIGPRLRAVVPRSIPLRYVARPERASPAEGKASDHAEEQDRLIQEAFKTA